MSALNFMWYSPPNISHDMEGQEPSVVGDVIKTNRLENLMLTEDQHGT